MFTRSKILVALLAAVFIWPVAAAAEPEGPKTFILEADLGPYDWYESGFGIAVDMDGGTLVGGYWEAAVGVYKLTPEGQWLDEWDYFWPDDQTGECVEWWDDDWCAAWQYDRFGRDVAISGDRFIAGAPWNAVHGERAGAAYVYVRRANGSIELEARLDPPEPLPSNEFGWAVDIQGTTVLVGAPGVQEGAGAVYVFARRSGVWVIEQTLHVTGSGGFGRDLALDGEQALITTASTAHMFVRESGSWTEAEQLNVVAAWCRASCVALAGDLAVVREEGADEPVAAFRKVSGVWRRIQTLDSPVPAEHPSGFGEAVAIGADKLVVGAPSSGDGGNGLAHVYDFRNGVWVYRETLEEGYSPHGAGFGRAIALDEGRLAVGAPSDHWGDGVVYIFVDTPTLFEVSLDVLPWRTPNRIDPTSTVLFPVAMHGAHDFDALQTDLTSLRLMPGDAPARNFRVMDVNRDGMPDLVPYFRARDLDIPCGESAVGLTGETHHGLEFHGADTVMNARCP